MSELDVTYSAGSAGAVCGLTGAEEAAEVTDEVSEAPDSLLW